MAEGTSTVPDFDTLTTRFASMRNSQQAHR